ncbi:hypothetical protein [Flavobacterium sp. PL002]|uniref:hypothetical protein n=1 Tax=Flavobacterium sp. PL002 TaxID=1897058 RepID=UPI0017888E44|nr:hypothetical protein [Flavobacterium sp. PL002]
MPNLESYIYTFNNPVKFVDPDGRRPYDWYENKSTGNIAWKNGSKEIDGYKRLNFTVSNQSYGKNKSDHLIMDGVTKKISINGNTIADFSKGSSGSFLKSGFTIWGNDRSGDTSGQKGTTTDSFESSSIPSIGESAPKMGQVSILGMLATIIKNFLNGASAAGVTAGVAGRVDTIVHETEDNLINMSIPETTLSGNSKSSSASFHTKDTIVKKN